jgi:hypothetical protein
VKPIYNVDIDQLALLLVPTFLRGGAVMGAALRAAVLPVAMNHTRLIRLLADTSDDMSYTAQAFNLARMLNDNFDPMKRRIAVDGVPNSSGAFTVRVPGSLNDGYGTASRIRASVDKYKLATKTYTVQWT